jgi:hypothetical protein
MDWLALPRRVGMIQRSNASRLTLFLASQSGGQFTSLSSFRDFSGTASISNAFSSWINTNGLRDATKSSREMPDYISNIFQLW